MRNKIVLAAILLCVLACACGKAENSSGSETTESVSSAVSSTESTEMAATGIYTNEDLGIRITPEDGFEPYESADTFAKALRGKDWKTAFGKSNRFEFGYVVSGDSGNGYFYGYSTELSEEEQEHDLSDFVTALELQIKDGEVQEDGTQDIGSYTWQKLVVSENDSAQEIIFLTKCDNSIVAIVIGQMENAPIEDRCLAAIENA